MAKPAHHGPENGHQRCEDLTIPQSWGSGRQRNSGSCTVSILPGFFESRPEAGAGNEADGAVGFVASDNRQVPDIPGGKALEDGEEVFLGHGGVPLGGHYVFYSEGLPLGLEDPVRGEEGNASAEFVVPHNVQAGQAVVAHEVDGVGYRAADGHKDWQMKHIRPPSNRKLNCRRKPSVVSGCHRPSATDVRPGTETLSPGSVRGWFGTLDFPMRQDVAIRQ